MKLQGFWILIAILLFPRIVFACPFVNAEYIPDPKDNRTRTNYYQYKITVTPDLRLMLNLIHPSGKAIVTKLGMQYRVDRDADPSALVWLSQSERLEVDFFDAGLQRVPVYSGDADAPATMILRDSHAKFLTLDDEGLDIKYFTDGRVKPGAQVNGRLELVPDVWTLAKCWDGRE